MMLLMSVMMLFGCGDLTEDLNTKSDSKRDNTPKYSVQNKEREVTGPTTEECSFEKITMVGDQKTSKKYTFTLRRSLKGIEEYRKDVSSFEYTHKDNNPVSRGESAEVRTEDNAKVYGRTDNLGAKKVNGFESDEITTSYDFYHEKLVFNDGDVEVVFDYEDVGFTDKVTEVKQITSPVTGKEAARLNNTIATRYIGYSQDASESVVLLMEKGVTIVSEDFVTSTEKETVTDNTVTAYILYRVEKSDGTHEDYPLEFSDSRDGKEDNPWTVIQASNSQTTSYVQKSDAGSTDKSDNKDGATAKWKRYKYVLTSVTTFPDGTTKDNVVRTTEPEGWEITFRGKTHTFKRPTYSQTNTRGSVSGGSEVSGYKVYDFVDKFSYSRGSNTKNFSPKGTIKVKEEVRIISEDFVTSTEKETVTDNTVTAYILYRVEKSDGTHEDYPLEFSDSRDGKEDNPWTVIQASNSQTTSYVQKSDAGSTDKSDNKDGATAKWKRYKYVLTSVTTFPDGTTKDNVVRTTEPEGWEITFRGKTHTFKRPTYSQTNTRGSVSGGSEVSGYKVYDFVDKFSYSRGSNTKNFSPKGTIKVKKSEPTFFPEEWGTLLNAKQTVANNRNHNSFVYTWLLEFENDVVLPVVIASGSTDPDWHFEYAEKTSVKTYNGGTYDKATNTWIATTASDKPNQMVWSRNSKEKANKDYSVARNQNWDEGHTVDGHPSTQTSRYQLTVKNGILTAKDTYTGRNMGSWK